MARRERRRGEIRRALVLAWTMALGAVFREALASAGATDAGAWVDAPDLDAQLAALYARGREAFPGLEVADETFVRHLGGVLARDRADAQALEDRFVRFVGD